MKNLFHLLLLLAITLNSGCGSSGSSDNSSEKIYPLFPANYLSSTYSETYTLTGEDQIGIPYDAIYSIETRTETTFDSKSTIPIFEYLNFKNLLTQLSLVIPTTTYYSTSLSNLEIIALSDSLNGLDTVSATTSEIPQTAKIGDFGDVGTYIDNAGNTTVYTWELTKARKGNAHLTFYATITDQHNELKGTVEKTYEINTTGERSNIFIEIYYKKQGATLTFSGSKD